jgi:putative membrane protein
MNRIAAFAVLTAVAVTDPEFVMKASQSGLAEVHLAKLALKLSENADVKKFAERMVKDHSAANRELTVLADKKKIPVAKEMDKDHHDLAAKLAKLQGPEFDRAFMNAMVKDHEAAVALFTSETKDSKDQDLKTFASNTLPTIKDHLAQARDLAAKLGRGK